MKSDFSSTPISPVRIPLRMLNNLPLAPRLTFTAALMLVKAVSIRAIPFLETSRSKRWSLRTSS
ncbi:hypothetical protein FHS26_001903 [Rhizobium pisi]|uniref:Uncharacterized protein n=1 Tax=Rhizobium pisi TaxID=574561 RepID=A0A7W5BJQ0_9HYPH|nr:hypothetical protein [Rhizobium pisi]